MKKLILVQAILVLLFCQYSTAFSFNGAMNSLALEIYTKLTDKEVSQNELYGSSDSMTKLAQQIKVAAQHRQNGTTPLKTGPLMGVHNPSANHSNEKVTPEDKMTKLAKSIASAFAASQPQQSPNKTQNTTSPVKPDVVVPEVKQNTTNVTQPAQNVTVPEPVVVVEVNKTQETNQTVQNNTTVTEPAIVVVENNKTQETNQTNQTNQTAETSQPTQTNETTTQTKPTIPPVHSTRPIGIEKTETPKMEVEAECGAQVQHSLAIIYDLGVHAASGNVDKVRRDYDALKSITLNLNKACYKSFSINIKPRPFFNNTGVCESELSELQKLAANFNIQNSKDMISFAKTLQNFWYRHINFVSSCIETSNTTSNTTIGIEKTEIPEMKVEEECANKIQHSLAIIYDLGVHSAAENIEKVRRDYDALKTITTELNKVCSKSFSINIHPHPFFNNTGACQSELSELQKLAVNYNQNSKDIISFAKTLQNFWYRHGNFVSSCIETSSNTTIGIEKTEVPEMKVEDECAKKIEHSLAIIYDLGVHAAAENVDHVSRDYDALKTITLNLNKVCEKSFSINIKPHPFFNNTGVCGSELAELQKLAINFNQNSKDKISFAKTIQNFWYRHINFVSSCIETSSNTTVGIEKTVVPEMKVGDECAKKIEHSLAIIYDLGVNSAAENVEKVRRDYDALKTITTDLNKVCSKSFFINIKPHPFFNNTGVCKSELSELQKLAINFNQNSKDKISFAKTLQNFWYRHINFVSSCVDTPAAPIGIEKTEVPVMKVEDECATKIQHSLAIIYDLGVHSAAENVEKVKRDYDALKTITLDLNKACSNSFFINTHPHPFFNNTGVCGSELSELQKLATNYNQNSKDKISFAKTIQNFWYRHINFVSSCVENTTNTANTTQSTQPIQQSEEQRETQCILSYAEAMSAVNKMNGKIVSWNPSSTKTLINNLNTRIASINNFCSAKLSVNIESTQAAQGNCQKDTILLKTAVENFVSENSKDLVRVAQTLGEISLIGKQILADC